MIPKSATGTLDYAKPQRSLSQVASGRVLATFPTASGSGSGRLPPHGWCTTSNSPSRPDVDSHVCPLRDYTRDHIDLASTTSIAKPANTSTTPTNIIANQSSN